MEKLLPDEMTIFYVELSWNCKIKYKRNKRQSKRGEWEKDDREREGGWDGSEKERLDCYCHRRGFNLKTHSRLFCPIRQITDEQLTPEETGGVR